MVITMEFCPFSDLSNYLKFRNITWKKNPLKECEIKNFLQQLVEGYDVLYRAKVIHRDLKPQNILLWQSGNEEPTLYPPERIILKIADFGISRFLNESGIALTVAGTPLYKAPEVNSQSYDYKVDLWSLGIIIIECLIGPKKFLEMSTTTSLWTFELFEPCLATLMISQDLYDLLTGLLKISPSKRIDFDTIIKHKFLSMSTDFLEKFKKEDKPVRHDLLRMVSEFVEKHKIEDNFLRQTNFSSKYDELLFRNTTTSEDHFCFKRRLMQALECFEKCKNEVPNLNASAQNNVSILLHQPSSSGMADSGPLAEEKIQEEVQVRKPFQCIDRGPCRTLPSGELACEMCPMCHIMICERRDVSYFENVKENLQGGVCMPFVLGNLGGPCDLLKLYGGQVVCQLCPICHTAHNSNASAQSNVSTLVPKPSTSGMDVSSSLAEEKNQKEMEYLMEWRKMVKWLIPQPSTSDMDSSSTSSSSEEENQEEIEDFIFALLNKWNG